MIFRILFKLAPAFQSFMSSRYTCDEKDGYRICTGRLWRTTRSPDGTCTVAAMPMSYIMMRYNGAIEMYNGYVLQPNDIVVVETPAGEIAYQYAEILRRIREVCA